MTPEETAKAEIRELRHRLREVRTENAELKIQYKRWLVLTCCVSMCSLVLCVILVLKPSPYSKFFDEIAQQEENEQNPPLETAQVIKDEIAESSVLAMENSDPNDLFEFEGEGDTIDPGFAVTSFDAPDMDDPKFEDFSKAEPIQKSVEPTKPKRATSFSLPKSNKKVKYHTVEKNDSLWKLSQKYYGSYNYVEKIKQDNNLRGKILKPGMRLKIVLP